MEGKNIKKEKTRDCRVLSTINKMFREIKDIYKARIHNRNDEIFCADYQRTVLEIIEIIIQIETLCCVLQPDAIIRWRVKRDDLFFFCEGKSKDVKVISGSLDNLNYTYMVFYPEEK